MGKKHTQREAEESAPDQAELAQPSIAESDVTVESNSSESDTLVTEPAPQKSASVAKILEGMPDPDPLMQEVRSFLDQRAMLARKLAEEIAATEKKLAELKRTAAQLFPEHTSGDSGKERKAKKQKPKSTVKPEPTAST